MFKIGDTVEMVNSNPKFGIGKVSVGDIGIVVEKRSDGEYKVDFPAQQNWSAHPNDIQLKGVPDEELPEISIDEAVGQYRVVADQMAELQARADVYLQVMRKYNIKPL